MAAKKETDMPDIFQSRLKVLGLGLVLGAIWGALMWGASVAMGRDADPLMALYLIVSMGMIGAGVAAIFGANAARKRGERVTPRIGRRR